jgi:hypothetical protein
VVTSEQRLFDQEVDAADVDVTVGRVGLYQMQLPDLGADLWLGAHIESDRGTFRLNAGC